MGDIEKERIYDYLYSQALILIRTKEGEAVHKKLDEFRTKAKNKTSCEE